MPLVFLSRPTASCTPPPLPPLWKIFISLNSQIRILKPEKGIGPTKPPALETPLDPLPEF